MVRKKIAVVGGGVAGIACAWSLSRFHDVTLFEKEECLGGHAFSLKIQTEVGEISVDMGVEFFSEKQAPNLWLLLQQFGLSSYVAPLSFSAQFDSHFWSNQGAGDLWPALKEECSRFHVDMHNIFSNPQKKGQTLRAFLKERHYTETFITKALYPLLTTFSSCRARLDDYTLMFCALSFSMNLLSFFQPTYWRKVSGGIGAFIRAFSQKIEGRLFYGEAVQGIRRHGKQVEILFQKRPSMFFDDVVIATHADQALKLLENATRKEQELLNGFSYSKIYSVLHQDASILKGPAFHPPSYLTYHIHSDQPQGHTGSLTRYLNALTDYQHLQDSILVTFDPKTKLKKIVTEKHWKIPQLFPQDIVRRRCLKTIQGHGHVWFCGTDTTFSGHEGALLSGLVLAEYLGAPYPFAQFPWAKVHYDVVKGLMGLYKPLERVGVFSNMCIHQAAKLFGLHQGQMARMILALYT